MSEKQQGVIALIIAAFIGGAVTPTLARIGVADFNPILFVFLRSFIAVLFLVPILYKERKTFHSKNFLQFLALGGVFVGMNLGLFSVGITHTTVVASQLLYALLPISVPLAAYFLTKERLNSKKALGACIGLLGVFLLIFFSRSAEQRLSLGSFQGNSIIFAAVIFYTFFMVLSKPLAKKYSALFASGITYLGISLFFLPFTLYQVLSGQATKEIFAAHPISWIVVLVLGFSGIVFMFFLQYGIKQLSSTTTAISVLLAPEFGALAGWLVFGEKVSFILFISLVLVIVGVLVSLTGEQVSLVEKIRGLPARAYQKVFAKR
jgi:drug/metabolite transporter (DMT)-like permease